MFLAIHLSTPLEIHGLITATLFFLLMYQDSNGQVTACVDRCCACRHRHLEVWPRPGSDTARRTSLARRHRPGVFQAGSDSSPASVRPRTADLSDYCVPAADVDTRQHLRSGNRQLLAVPRNRLNTYGYRVFSVAGPRASSHGWGAMSGYWSKSWC